MCHLFSRNLKFATVIVCVTLISRFLKIAKFAKLRCRENFKLLGSQIHYTDSTNILYEGLQVPILSPFAQRFYHSLTAGDCEQEWYK